MVDFPMTATERWSMFRRQRGLWCIFAGGATAMLLACGNDAGVPSTPDGGSDDTDAGVRDCFDYPSPAEACRERPDCRAQIAASEPYFVGSGATRGCTFDTSLEKCSASTAEGSSCRYEGTCFRDLIDCFPTHEEFYKGCGISIVGVCWPVRDGGS